MSTKQDESKRILAGLSNEEYNQNLEYLKTIPIFNAADSHPMPKEARAVMVDQAAEKLKEMFLILKLDYNTDENLLDTPMRVASMWVNELMVGRYIAPPRIEAFPASYYYIPEKKITPENEELAKELKICVDEIDAICDAFYFVNSKKGTDYSTTLTDDLLREVEKLVYRKEMLERAINPDKVRVNVVSKTIDVNSLCSHHLISFVSTDDKDSKCVISYIPEVGKEKALLGISKLQRVADWFGRRPQLQEHLNWQIKTFLMMILRSSNVMVSFQNIIHYCEKTRGVESHCGSTSSIEFSGKFLEPDIRELPFKITGQ